MFYKNDTESNYNSCIVVCHVVGKGERPKVVGKVVKEAEQVPVEISTFYFKCKAMIKYC